METKICFKCGLEKELSEFYKHPKMLDGYLNKCKECNKKDVSENYRKNIEYYKQYEKKRAVLQHRKERCKEYNRTHQKKINEIKKKWLKNNPEKRKAHLLVQYEIRKGKIVKPENCEICNIKTDKLDAHHEDYTKPLEIIFLCKKCHSGIHHGKRAKKCPQP